MSGGQFEFNKVDPKCWLCSAYVKPLIKRYQPLICDVCLPEYKERKFLFVRASQVEIDELFGEDKWKPSV